MSDDLAMLDATAQAALIRLGELSPVEAVDAAIERIERLNPELNAVIHERFTQARIEAAGPLPDGPFRGVPMVLKDLDGVSAGDPFHAGMQHLKDAGYLADHDSWLTTRFRQMGAVFVGRTNTPEFGLLPSTEPAAYGPTHNPWDPTRSPAGSSGGSAAAVASGMVALGHAGDGGGSIRLPASVCGLVGLKPTRGRCSIGPEAGEAWAGLVSRLVVTRSVRDTAGVLDAVWGSAPGDPYTAPPPLRPYLDELTASPRALRIGWTNGSPDPTAPTHDDVAAVVRTAAEALAGLGHRVDEAAPASWADPDAGVAFTTHFLNAMGVWVAAEADHVGVLTGTAVTEAGVEPHTWAMAEFGRSVSGTTYFAAIEAIHAYGRTMAGFWADDDYDLLVTPTIPEAPWTLGQFGPEEGNPLAGMFRAAAIVPFTAPFNATGQPAISLPLGETPSGLPVGVQLVAAAGREDLLLAVAAQLEEALPWADRRPGIHA